MFKATKIFVLIGVGFISLCAIGFASYPEYVGIPIAYETSLELAASGTIPARLCLDDYNKEQLKLDSPTDVEILSAIEKRIDFKNGIGILKAVGKVQVIASHNIALIQELDRWRINFSVQDVNGAQKIVYGGSGLLVNHSGKLLFVTHSLFVFDVRARVNLYFNFCQQLGQTGNDNGLHLDFPPAAEVKHIVLGSEYFYENKPLAVAVIELKTTESAAWAWQERYRYNLTQPIKAFAIHYPLNRELGGREVMIDYAPTYDAGAFLDATGDNTTFLSPGAPIFTTTGELLGMAVYQFDEPRSGEMVSKIVKIKEAVALMQKGKKEKLQIEE